MLVQVYVDDIIFGSTKKYWCDKFKELMKNRFQISSMGELTFFLGLQVKQKEDGIFISQDKYVAEIFKKFVFLSVKTASTPIETQKPLVKDEEATDVDVYLYRSMIGSLMYLTASRPDIMFEVCACSRFQVTPKTSHLQVVKRIFRQVLWIQNLLLDYGFNLMNTKIYIDNNSTICIVKNPVFYSMIKHIEILHHFIRDAYEKKLIQVLKIHTDDNVADLLTKAFDVSSNELASPKQTALGKDELNVLIVNSLLKTIWLSMHHVIAMKHWLFQSKWLLAKVSAVSTNWGTTSLFNDSPLLEVNTPRCDEDSLEFMELMHVITAVSYKLMLFSLTKAAVNLMLLGDYLSPITNVYHVESRMLQVRTSSRSRYALTVSPTIHTSCIKQFWSTAKVKTVNDEVRVQALIDEKRVIIKESLVEEEGISCLANDEIFTDLDNMGYEKMFDKLTFYKAFFSPQWKFLIHTILQCLSTKTTSWNEFSRTMASTIICLATNQKFNFSRYILQSLVKNIEAGVPFYMFPRFVQLIVDHQLGDMSHHQDIYDNPSLTKKVFANIKRVGTGFSEVITPLFGNMLVQAAEEVGQALDDVSIPTEPSTSKLHKKHKYKK
nr:retrotransposon protein, putative, unclassified [Tanacetum cinerariifolium]